MSDEMRSGGIMQQSQHDELRYQQLDLKNTLPLNLFICMEYASLIQTAAVFGNTIQPKVIRGFYQTFWHIYHYVKGSVNIEALNPELIQLIDMWFKMMAGQNRNTKLILKGVEYCLEFEKTLQTLGIGQLLERGIDPPFMLEDTDDFDLLTEEIDEEVIAGADD